MMQLLLHKLARSLLSRSLQLPLIRATSYLNFGLFLGFTFPEMLFPSASAFRVQYLRKWWKGGVKHILAQLHSCEVLRFDLLYSCFYWVKVHPWYNATITPTEQQYIFGARSDGRPSQELLYLRGGALFCSISCSSFFHKSCVVVACCWELLRKVWNRSNFFNNRNRGWCVCNIMNLV